MDAALCPEGPVGFEAAWRRAEAVPGWLTRAQARVLWDEVRILPPAATVVEIGAHRGRSTLVLALARTDVEVVTIDPFVSGRLFGGRAVRAELVANLVRAGVGERVRLVEARAGDVLPRWAGPIGLLYVDGKHDVLTVRQDLAWARHVRPGGVVLVHDAFSSVGVTLGLVPALLAGTELTCTARTGSLARLETRPASGLCERLAPTVHLGWFARNLVVKLVLRGRRAVAALTGADVPPDPY